MKIHLIFKNRGCLFFCACYLPDMYDSNNLLDCKICKELHCTGQFISYRATAVPVPLCSRKETVIWKSSAMGVQAGTMNNFLWKKISNFPCLFFFCSESSELWLLASQKDEDEVISYFHIFCAFVRNVMIYCRISTLLLYGVAFGWY